MNKALQQNRSVKPRSIWLFTEIALKTVKKMVKYSLFLSLIYYYYNIFKYNWLD